MRIWKDPVSTMRDIFNGHAQEISQLKRLLREVLMSPSDHTWVRSYDRGTSVKRYTAKRLDDDLLVKIKEAVRP